MIFTVVIYCLAALGLMVSFVKDRGKTRASLKKAWKSFENILPQLLTILIVIGLALSILSPKVISDLIGANSGMIGTLTAALIGSITLIPGFVAFPLAAALLHSGAGYLQIAAFVSTLMMVGIVTLPMEMKIMGRPASIIRNVSAFVFSLIVAVVIGGILG